VLHAQTTPPESFAYRQSVRHEIDRVQILLVLNERGYKFLWIHAIAEQFSTLAGQLEDRAYLGRCPRTCCLWARWISEWWLTARS
jgi:hypothetical protein